MSFVYTRAKRDIFNADIDFNLPHDFRIILVDNTTTADTEEDAATISAFTTLGELSGAGYVRKALANEVVNEDTVNNRAEFDADDITWTGIDAGTAQAMILYKHVTNDTDSIPIAYIDTGGFPINTNGGDLTVQWNAEGILQGT